MTVPDYSYHFDPCSRCGSVEAVQHGGALDTLCLQCRLAPDTSLHARVARALGWSVEETRSFSLITLRELLRPVSLKLAHEVDLALQGAVVARYVEIEKKEIPMPAPLTTTPKTDTALAVRDAAVDEIRADADERLAVFEAFGVTDSETLTLAAEALVDVAAVKKRLEAEKRRATGPMNEALKTVRGWFAPIEATLAACDKCLRSKVAAYQTERAIGNQAAIDRVAEAAARDDAQAATEALAEIVTVESLKGVSMREHWDFTVIAVDMLDRQYLLPNVPAIRAEMQRQLACGERPPVLPGVKFTAENRCTVRAGGG